MSKIDINEVMTFKEASDIWKLGDGTLRHSAARGVFQDHEIRKSGCVWLITKEAMNRVYGEYQEEESW